MKPRIAKSMGTWIVLLPIAGPEVREDWALKAMRFAGRLNGGTGA